MYSINLDYYGDTAGLVVSYRGSTVKLYATDEAHDRLMAKAGGGGYDRAGTCLGEFLQGHFGPELARIASRADSRYRLTRGDGPNERIGVDDDGHAPYDRRSLYGMRAYYRGRKVERVHLDGGCGWDSMVRIAEAIGLQVKYVAETKNTKVYLLSGMAKIRDRRIRNAEKMAATA